MKYATLVPMHLHAGRRLGPNARYGRLLGALYADDLLAAAGHDRGRLDRQLHEPSTL